MKKTLLFLAASLSIGLIIDIYKWYELPDVDKLSSGILFIFIYVSIDIIMMNKILDLDLDVCLDRYFSPTKDCLTSIMCFLPFFISTYLYIWKDLSLFSIVIICIAVGDLYFFYNNTQKGE
ncbi:hypothetical protein [Shewanella denitrificans]|jgi:hypothetical protein|uniref:hypothetical protein n=1 Tax=Shewanella denitrificans TaxID=192073 RepID=UPI00059E3280|nr:hypothetical protein [Shewanella denitrificans]